MDQATDLVQYACHFSFFFPITDDFLEWPQTYIFGQDYFNKVLSLMPVYKFIDMSFVFIIPTLNVMYVVQRYIFICRPNSIPRYCTNTKVSIAVACIIAISCVASSHELFDTRLSALFQWLQRDRNGFGDHEQYSGQIMLPLLLIKGIFICVATLVLMHKMNSVLCENISFLQGIDGDRQQNRITSYQNLINFNIASSLLSIFSIGTKSSSVVFEHLTHGINESEWKSKVSYTILECFMSILDVFSNFQILLFPIMVLMYLPCSKWLKERLTCATKMHG